MTSYVLAIPEQPIVYPLTQAGLRAAYPTTLLPEGFAGLEELHVFPVTPTDQPEYDPNTHEAVEADPELIGNTWMQAWDVVELPEPVIVTEWRTFTTALMAAQYFVDRATGADAGYSDACFDLMVALEMHLEGCGNLAITQSAFERAFDDLANADDRIALQGILDASNISLEIPALTSS